MAKAMARGQGEVVTVAAPASRALFVAAGVNVALHAMGLVFAVWGIRPGTPLVPAAERTAYLALRPVGWSVGWGIWMLCALALVVLLAVVARELPESRGTPTLAVTLAAAGAAVDLLCDTLFITVLPTLAEAGPTPLFLGFERALGAGGAVVANGLYSVAVLLVTLSLPRGGPGSVARALGYATFAAGMGLVVAGFTGVPRHLELATGPTILLFMAWALAVARCLSRGPASP